MLKLREPDPPHHHPLSPNQRRARGRSNVCNTRLPVNPQPRLRNRNLALQTRQHQQLPAPSHRTVPPPTRCPCGIRRRLRNLSSRCWRDWGSERRRRRLTNLTTTRQLLTHHKLPRKFRQRYRRLHRLQQGERPLRRTPPHRRLPPRPRRNPGFSRRSQLLAQLRPRFPAPPPRLRPVRKRQPVSQACSRRCGKRRPRGVRHRFRAVLDQALLLRAVLVQAQPLLRQGHRLGCRGHRRIPELQDLSPSQHPSKRSRIQPRRRAPPSRAQPQRAQRQRAAPRGSPCPRLITRRSPRSA
jgi:hypothetical protein